MEGGGSILGITENRRRLLTSAAPAGGIGPDAALAAAFAAPRGALDRRGLRVGLVPPGSDFRLHAKARGGPCPAQSPCGVFCPVPLLPFEGPHKQWEATNPAGLEAGPFVHNVM